MRAEGVGPVAEHARIARRLREAGVTSADAEAWAMLETALDATRLRLRTEPDLRVVPAARRRIDAWIAGRTHGVPLQHLLGVAWFWELPLAAGPGALAPRPETEALVAAALASVRDRAAPLVLDVGTGSGAVAIAIATERPDAEVHGSDVEPRALELAARNVRRHAPAVRLHRADLLRDATLHALLPRLDLLIANLPYLPDADRDALPREVRHDPPRALFGGADGLEPFRALWRQASTGDGATRWAPSAHGWFELDPRNVQEAAREVRSSDPARAVTVHPDLAGRPRFLHVAPADGARPSPRSAPPPPR